MKFVTPVSSFLLALVPNLIRSVNGQSCAVSDYLIGFSFAGTLPCPQLCSTSTVCACVDDGLTSQFTQCYYGCEVCNKNKTACAESVSTAAYAETADGPLYAVQEDIVYTKGNERGQLSLLYVLVNDATFLVDANFTVANKTRDCPTNFVLVDGTYLGIKGSCRVSGKNATFLMCVNDNFGLEKCPNRPYSRPLFGFLTSGSTNTQCRNLDSTNVAGEGTIRSTAASTLSLTSTGASLGGGDRNLKHAALNANGTLQQLAELHDPSSLHLVLEMFTQKRADHHGRRDRH